MCAAKLERTGFVLRNAWPNFKHFAGEQSANLAHSSSESGFVRKNSQKAEAAAAGRSGCQVTSGAKAAPQRASFEQRRWHVTRSRLAPRPLAAGLLGKGPQSRSFAAAAASHGSEVPGRPLGLRPGLVERAAVSEILQKDAPRKGPATRSGVSIEELVKTASEKYELNEAFWGRYTDIPSMALAVEKEEILQIIENFALIHRKHLYLFQRLKATVLRTLDLWSASDLAALCHAWAQLGFLHEDLCVAMAERVKMTAYACSTQELCYLFDAYATARCSVQSVVSEITKLTMLRLDEFTPPQLCLHASSFARLNVRNEELFKSIAERLEQVPPTFEDTITGTTPSLSARDLTLAAYSFAKLGFHDLRVFETLSRSALPVIRDFTARDLQMFTVALVRARHRDTELLEVLSQQAQRRIAQFSSESLVLMLRGMAFFGRSNDLLFTRALAQLPRAILTFRPADATALLGSIAAAQIHSPALFQTMTPFILEKAPFFTPSDWLLALSSYSTLGHRDLAFLSALGLHLEASQLSLPQLGAALADCSRLSFSGASEVLASAAHSKVTAAGSSRCSANLVAQMYSALLLLGSSATCNGVSHSSGGGAPAALLRELTEQLRRAPVTAKELSPAACVDLCYASLLVPPLDASQGSQGSEVARHPVDILPLLERCTRHASALSRDGQLLLGLISQVLEQMMPWNATALRLAQQLKSLQSSATSSSTADGDLPDGCLIAAAGHLVPHQRHLRPSSEASNRSRTFSGSSTGEDLGTDELAAENSGWMSSGSERSGIFLATEIRDAMSGISATLAAAGVDHELDMDGPLEAHVLLLRQSLSQVLDLPVNAHPKNNVILLWGSPVHFLCSEEQTSSLSPAAKGQVAALQAAHVGALVLVLPHWRLPHIGRSAPTPQVAPEQGEALLRVLAEELRQPTALL